MFLCLINFPGEKVLLLSFIIGFLSAPAGGIGSLLNTIDCEYLQPWDADEYGTRPWSDCSDSASSSESLEDDNDDDDDDEDPLPFGVRVWGSGTTLVFDIQDGNPEIIQTGTDPMSCKQKDCTFTWLDDVTDHDNDIKIYYAIKDGWDVFNESSRINSMSLCEASHTQSGTRMYDAWKLLSYLIAGNVQQCPIHAGTYNIPPTFNFTFTNKEYMPCSNDTRFDVQLMSADNVWYPWTVVRAINRVPDSFNCTEME